MAHTAQFEQYANYGDIFARSSREIELIETHHTTYL